MKKVRNKWIAWIFGGNFVQENCGGIGWNPPLWRLVQRYYKEGWKKGGYSLWQFIEPYHLQQKRYAAERLTRK